MKLHERFGINTPSEYSTRDKIKEAARHLQQALNLMCQVDECCDTSEDIKNKIKKIIDAFTMDKSELERIIEHYYDNKRL